MRLTCVKTFAYITQGIKKDTPLKVVSIKLSPHRKSKQKRGSCKETLLIFVKKDLGRFYFSFTLSILIYTPFSTLAL